MNIEVEIRNISRPVAAFTLIELLVVIAIIGILAGLIVGLGGVVGDKKSISRTRAELERLETLIEAYKAKLGVYPPDNPNNPLAPTNTSLFYELAGAQKLPNGDFDTPFGIVSAATLNAACGVGGIVNSWSGDIEDRARVQRLITQVKSDQTNVINVSGQTIIVFVSPVEGTNGRTVNPIFYRAGTNAIKNPGQYDIWAEIKVRRGVPNAVPGKQTKVIGNWKD